MKLEFKDVDEFIDFINKITINKEETIEIINAETNIKEPLEEISEIVTVRTYNDTQKERFPQIIKMNDDGTFQIANAKNKENLAKWTIQDILIIKARIPQTEKYPSWKAMSEDLPISSFAVQYLAYGIEHGCFDKYINQWEQLQANEFYGKWKPVATENNVQKRKEQGMS